MTSKELLYIEDALAHEQFIQKCCSNTNFQDTELASYIQELENKHNQIFSKLLNLL